MQRSEEDIFEQYLESRGMKYTAERKSILNEVFCIHGHFEAEDVVMGLHAKGIRVSRASVYRTLPMLVDCGLLREVYSAEKHNHYEHVFGHEHHDHLICTRCGREIEFSNQLIEDLQDRICEKHNFKPISHKLEISGLCSQCQAKEHSTKTGDNHDAS